ncbi:unnamed protein product [Trichobilharzia regenti]|nr:unnamed protein product [Trichobilharzia regenti]
MSPLNAVICGRNELTASVIRILRRNKYVNIVGYWCDSVKSQLHADVAGIKVIGGTFEDLLSNKEIHFLFLCDTPLNQQSFVSRLCDQIKCFQNSNVKQVSDLPYVIVFPPFSPNYDFELLKLFRNKVDIPFSEDVACKRSEVYSCDNHRFKLQVEICGSAGCFVADESERQISWTSRKSCSPKAKYVSDEYSTVRPKHDCNGFSHERPVQRVNDTELTNGKDHFESYSTGLVETQTNHFPRTRAISKPPFHIEKVNGITEVARLPLNVSRCYYYYYQCECSDLYVLWIYLVINKPKASILCFKTHVLTVKPKILWQQGSK